MEGADLLLLPPADLLPPPATLETTRWEQQRMGALVRAIRTAMQAKLAKGAVAGDVQVRGRGPGGIGLRRCGRSGFRSWREGPDVHLAYTLHSSAPGPPACSLQRGTLQQCSRQDV